MKQTIKSKVENGMYDKIILQKLSEGSKNKDLIKTTGLSEKYVSYNLKLLRKKFNAENKIQLIINAYLKGVIS